MFNSDLKKNINIEEYKGLRHLLHEHPEVGFEAEYIGKTVAANLTLWGYEVHQGLGETGIVGTLKVGDGPKILGLRADMDALPIIENSGKPWSSKVHGKFHGCGHDGHTTMLLAAAEYLSKTKQFNGTLRVIFQPAEETLAGGKAMIGDGLFTQFPCDNIFALHNFPTVPTHHFFYAPGIAMASSDIIYLEIHGKGGHGAMPERTVDATMVAAHIIVALQSIVSRNIPPQEAGVITVGSVQSGNAANVISEQASMKLSVRALSKETRDTLVKRIKELVVTQAESFGARCDFRLINSCPVTENEDAALSFATQIAQDVVGEDKVHQVLPLMGSEDFAFMLQEVPGCYIFLGAGDGPFLHNPQYDFNDEIIETGAKFWVHLTQSYLK